jgi:hypothetical protein
MFNKDVKKKIKQLDERLNRVEKALRCKWGSKTYNWENGPCDIDQYADINLLLEKIIEYFGIEFEEIDAKEAELIIKHIKKED